ncbi:MAG TPA: hypothetical protein VNS81_09220 [Nocardioides sp.]|nr:hypothetical protein [Nocardioides sp.]
MSTRLRAATAVLLVLVVLAAAALAWALLRGDPDYTPSAYHEKDGSYAVGWVPGGSAPVRAATRGARHALAYDYRKLDAGLSSATALMTRDFAVEFRDTFEQVVRKDAKRDRTVSVALVKGAGLVSSSKDRAQVLVFVNQVLLSSKDVAAGEKVRNVLQARVRMSLARVDGRWLVDGIEPF